MQLKSCEIKKNAAAKTGVTIDYSIPDQLDYDELKEITGLDGEEGVFDFIVALYEKKLQGSMRMRIYPTMRNIKHPKTGKKYKITALDPDDKDAMKSAIESVKLVKPKTAPKAVTAESAWAKIEADLKAAGVNAERIKEFKRQRDELIEMGETAAAAD